METLYLIALALLLTGWLAFGSRGSDEASPFVAGQLLCGSMIALYDHQLVDYEFWIYIRMLFLVLAFGAALWPHRSSLTAWLTSPLGSQLRRLRNWYESQRDLNAILACFAVALSVVVLLASTGLSDDRFHSIPSSLRWIATLLTGLLLSHSMSVGSRQKLLIQFFALYFAALLLGFVLVPDQAIDSIRAPVIDILVVAPHLGDRALTAMIGIAALIVGLSTIRPARFFALFASALLLLATQSRSLIVAAACIIFVWTFTLAKRTRFLIWAAGLVVVLAGITGPGRTLWDREQAHPESANATTYRSTVFEEAIDRFQASPIIGQGLGVGDRDLVIDVGKPGLKWATHSEMGTALAATGALGSIAIATIYLTSFASCLKRFQRQADWLPLAVISAMIVTIPVITWLSRVSLLTLPFLFLVMPVVINPTRELDQ